MGEGQRIREMMEGSQTVLASDGFKEQNNCFLTFNMSGWCQTLFMESQKSLLFLCKREAFQVVNVSELSFIWK